jgi:hypothetical protein
MDTEYVTITATVTDRWGAVETVYAGQQSLWSWEQDRCADWRKMYRKLLLGDRTLDPRGWRVVFTAEAEGEK